MNTICFTFYIDKVLHTINDMTPNTITNYFAKGFIIPAIILLVVYIFTESSDAGCFSIIFAIMSGLCCGMGESIKNKKKIRLFLYVK